MSGRHAREAPQPAPAEAAFAWHGYAPLQASIGVQVRSAAGDLAEGLRRWRSWTYLAVENVKNQYRRTVLGPWWVTLQTTAFVIGLAILFGSIFRQPLDEFVPYVGGGFICYTLLAGLTSQASNVFVDNSSTITSTRQPLSVLVFRAAMIELLQFGHNLIIIGAFLAIGLVPLSPKLLLMVPAILIILLNGVALGLWVGPTVARFRDVGPFVAAVLQVMIFFTPVFWRVEDLAADSRGALLGWNPFAYLLGLFRDPLLGELPSALTWTGVAAVTGINMALGLWVFTRNRSRLPYWVS